MLVTQTAKPLGSDIGQDRDNDHSKVVCSPTCRVCHRNRAPTKIGVCRFCKEGRYNVRPFVVYWDNGSFDTFWGDTIQDALANHNASDLTDNIDIYACGYNRYWFWNDEEACWVHRDELNTDQLLNS